MCMRFPVVRPSDQVNTRLIGCHGPYFNTVHFRGVMIAQLDGALNQMFERVS